MTRVLIMAGGTGGHIFPALAVAQLLQQQGISVYWLGTCQGLETQLVPKAQIPINYISVSGLRKKGFSKLLIAPWQLLRATYQALCVIRTLKPDVILGMGGFVSGPGGLAAWLVRKPLLIHEQNSVAGMTNKILARFATQVLAAFPGAFGKHCQAITVGNPVRNEIKALPTPVERMQDRTGRMRLLVIGGSQGALAINQLLPQALNLLSESERPEVWHQTGRYQQQAEVAYKNSNTHVKLQPFIDDMAEAYAWADFVICRAGALTVSELMTAGIGSLLIPYPYAVDDHQTSNAQFLVQAGAAILLPQTNLTAQQLADTLHAVLNQKEKWLVMAQAARNLQQQDAAEKVVEYCLSAASGNSNIMIKRASHD